MNNVEGHLMKSGLSFIRVTNSPMMNNYIHECSVISDLNDTKSIYYASLIGILRWMVDMGKSDIACEVYMMLSYVAMPIEGHLQQLYHIFS